MSRYYRIAAPLALVGTLLGCSADDSQDYGDANLGSARSAIINGTELNYNRTGTVALFRMDTDNNNNWRFTCSGRVLNPHEQGKIILTARHCVTVDGTIRGDLVGARDRLVTALVDPGLYPGDTSTDYQRGAGPVFDHPTADAAIFVIQGDIGLTPQDPIGLNPLPISELLGKDIRHYGYGFGAPWDYQTLGRYRRGTNFELLGSYPSDDEYKYQNPADHRAGYEVEHGDSGGPGVFRVLPSGVNYVHYQTGIHSAKAWDVDIEQIWDWLIEELGFFYLRSAQYSERRVFWEEVASRTLVETVPNTSADMRSRLIYHKDSKTIEVLNSSGLGSNKCIDLKWNNTTNGTPFWLWTCNGGSAQRFVPTVDYQLELEGHPGKCLEESSSHSLVVADCTNTAAQTWIFNYDPGAH